MRLRGCAQVEAVINRPEAATSAASNTFSFQFEVDVAGPPGTPSAPGASSGAQAARPLKRVLPASAAQARLIERYYPSQYETIAA